MVLKEDENKGSEVEIEGHGLESAPEPIDVLLNLSEDSLKVEDKVHVKRLGIYWVIRSLNHDEFKEVADRSIKRVTENGRRGARIQLDDNLSQLLQIVYASISPDLRDDRLYQKYNVDKFHPENLVKKLLLPGEIVAISSHISRISGFDDMFAQFMEVAENL